MFELTKTSAEPKAQSTPTGLDVEASKVDASMTPIVKGSSDMYVLGEYLTPKRSAYAATVKSGDNAFGLI